MNAVFKSGIQLTNMTDFYIQNGKHPISKVLAGKDLKESVKKSVDAIGGLEKVISHGDTVILKPNFNSDDLPPASSDPEFVRAVVELCREAGASNVKIMDCSGFAWQPTQRVFDKTGMTRVAKECNAELIPLDATIVRELNLQNTKEVTTAYIYEKIFEEGAKLIWIPCMKTHTYSRFSMSLNLIVGLLDSTKRQWLHSDDNKLELKIAELNTCVSPHLIIMDARSAFSSGGPSKGRVVYPNSILASGDRITMDVEALKILLSYPDDNLLDLENPWNYVQIKRSVELGLGAKNDNEIEFV